MENKSVIDLTARGTSFEALMDAEVLPMDLFDTVEASDDSLSYRFLQVGETIQAGDEVESANGWKLVSQRFLDLDLDGIHNVIVSDDVGYWRRKLA
jgi:hypothetical protein